MEKKFLKTQAPRPGRCSRAAGFTLVEVMVALLILAMALSALQFRITQHVNDSAYLRDKTIASWVAQDRLELLRLESRLNNTAITEVRSGTVTMAGRRWRWRVSPLQQTGLGEESRIVPLDITVAAEGDGATPLVSLTGVVDGWHRLQ